jgi:glycosyltransferase involved in cell wall biosynthesis
LRRRARRLVYDIDDAVHLAPPHPLRFPWRLMEDRGQIRSLMAASDLVLAGNQWLADEAVAAGATKVEHFPTVVDTDRFNVAVQASSDLAVRASSLRDPVFRIGWIGNPSTVVCLEPARAALEQVKDAEICLVGTDPARANLPRAEHREWSYDSEVSELQRFTIGIMPQPAEPWMRGKCALKVLQYMACGIPCVASPFGAVTEFLRHDENGLFAETTRDWLEAFDRLRDPALRARLATAARQTVLERYSLKHAAARMGELLERMTDSDR